MKKVKPVKTNPFGWHLMLNLYGCNPKLIADKKAVAKFASELCQLIKMKAFGNPIVKKFGKPGTVAEGLTLVQLIETSAITAHFSDSTQSIYLDLFSCRLFNPKTVENFTKKYFQAQNSKIYFTERGPKS